jgi:alkyldihydroxyacetonephosphate synthase
VLRPHSAPSPPRTPALPASALDGDGLLDELRAIGGHDAVRTDSQSRLRHAAGRSYLDLLELRSGMLEHVPDAVVIPAGAVETAAVLRACARAGCAVVPFGGGTSVVGGVRPVRGGHRAVVALVTRRLDACTAVDPASLTASLGAGHDRVQAEAALAAHGLTLGHFLQAFEFATVGFAATRSAGQASSGYGRFDDIALGLQLVTPTGEIASRLARPRRPALRSASSPSARRAGSG